MIIVVIYINEDITEEPIWIISVYIFSGVFVWGIKLKVFDWIAEPGFGGVVGTVGCVPVFTLARCGAELSALCLLLWFCCTSDYSERSLGPTDCSLNPAQQLFLLFLSKMSIFFFFSVQTRRSSPQHIRCSAQPLFCNYECQHVLIVTQLLLNHKSGRATFTAS